MSKTILVTGGARSGKSLIAERRALELSPRAVYVATGQPSDPEMAARIAAHRARRGDAWETIEEPHDLAGALLRTDGRGARLVDCLTLWLANRMAAGAAWKDEAAALAETLRAQRDPVVLVTNEVGSGIVPENALARAFRDAQGMLNQIVAGVADEVTLAVCGLPLRVK